MLAGISEGEFDEDLTTGFQFLTHGGGETVLQSSVTSAVPNHWILLDNQSTVDVFQNAKLLRNIRKAESFMDIHCNAGVASTNLVGELPGYGTVWYHPKGIANILSLARVRERGYTITFDSHNGNCFRVIKPDGSMRVFRQSGRGLYYMSVKPGDVTLVDTVDDNRSRYNNRDYSQAVLARKIQSLIGRPSTRTYKAIVDANLLPNCPVTRRDITAAEDIFGPDVGSLKGKTVRKPVPRARTRLINVPFKLMKLYRDVIVACDIMFVNRIPFFVTTSHHLRFNTAEMVTDQKASTLLTAIKQVRDIYAQRGFRVTVAIMDGQFEPLRGDLAGLNIGLQVAGHDDHVPEVERYIRTLKERVRAIYNTLPFQTLPARLVIEMVYYCNFWLNAFPHPDGVSNTLSPRNIVTGHGIDFTKHCRIEFGAYAQVHEDHDNSMAPRTVGAIALRPTGNEHGSYYFFNLNTGRLLNRSRWTELPMPDDVITRVHKMSRRGRQGLEFLNRNGQPFIYPAAPADAGDDNDDEDESFHLGDDNDDDAPDDANIPPDIAGVYDNAGYDAAADNYNLDPEDGHDEPNFDDGHDEPNFDDVPFDMGEQDVPGAAEAPPNNPPMMIANQGNDNNIPGMDDPHAPMDIAGVPIAEVMPAAGIIADDDDDGGDPIPDIAAEMETRYGHRSERYNLRARKPRQYSHMHTIIQGLGDRQSSDPSCNHTKIKPRKPLDYGHVHTVLEHTVMTQHGLKKGLKGVWRCRSGGSAQGITTTT